MTSEPPPASSWAVPPEFYTDENAGTRAVRRRLVGLGYVVHTPPELYGNSDEAQGALDQDWLARVGSHRWTAITPLRQVGTWRLTRGGPEPYDIDVALKRASRRSGH
jgi:hypothetical protein